MTFRTVTTTAVLLSLCLAGCTGGKDDKTSSKTGASSGKSEAKEAPKPGGDSPADVYEKMKAVQTGESIDTQAFAELCSPPFRKQFAGMMILMGGFVIDKDKQEPAKKALDDLCKEHGIKKPAKVDFKHADAAVEAMMKDVGDSVAVAKAVMDWLLEFSTKMKTNMTQDKPLGELTEVQVKGDFAMGKGKTEKHKQGEVKEVLSKKYFRKVDGRWYVDESKEVKDAFRAPPGGAKKTG